MIQSAEDITHTLHRAVQLHASGDLLEAEKQLRAILESDPLQVQANYYLGTVLLESLQALESLPYFNAALESDPQQAQHWLSYIAALIDAEHYEDAKLVLTYGRDAGLDGKSVDYLEQLLAQRQAESLQLAAKTEAMPAAHMQEKLIQLFLNKRYQVAEAALQPLLATYPKWLVGWKMLSDILLVQKKDARLAASHALALNQDDAQEHCYYGLVLKGQGDLVNAAATFKQAIELQPDYAAAYNNLGIVTKDMGDVAAAVAYYRKALAINPGYASCYSNLLFCLSHTDIVSADDLFIEHRKFGAQYEAVYKSAWPKHSHQADVAKRLHVGFVSADFREHSLANFFEPVLEHLSQVADIALHAYANNAIEDGVTQRLKAKFKYWNKVDDLTDAALAERVRADKIDILVDLDGHTAGNRLISFAMKPAPIQISWLGYLATTGLTAMDYYLADAHLLPPGQFDQQFTEKIVQLPANAPFTPSALSPAVGALPALSNDFITFGCFNRVEKITPSVIKLWSGLLNAVPNSKLLLGAMPKDGSYDGVINELASHAISADRLIIHHRSTMDNYLKLHNLVDICLDTFPSNGVTTTCHAAWMGVPTLCLEGQSLMSRGAMAVMLHLGLPEFVVKSHDDFINKGIDWAEHLQYLSEVRAALRKKFNDSALNQPQFISENLVLALRTMWVRWCKKQPTISFKIPD
ncbi:tetratricopeptide repeat protein [Methylotenera mobilis]|uniref:protein O-GlcNAc transferase n=1 Tax=Methylotenera mobilis (strain JLW8 / ATCC BAA-1282 / DSM 17540) TaxID=583345 RepID=C6WV78_METML|nr:tetratricopeptide repeat protein [Methylotenera mobilis]ACT47827.1 Tetratricopeptide TPR_2 repeat protein [Methylotenera mobilis JLW8]